MGCNCLIRKNIVSERLIQPAKINNEEKIGEEKEILFLFFTIFLVLL